MFSRMSGFENNLFDEFRRMSREMEQLFGTGPTVNGIRSVARGTYPPINIGTTADQIDVYLFAAGVDLDSFDISIQQNLLSIDGKRQPEGDDARTEYYRRERFTGDFHRVVTLPDDVDPDKVSATYKDGVLRITIERRESAKPRRITIN